MKSRLEHVLGFEYQVPASSTAKRIVVSDSSPTDDIKGYAPGCLWVKTDGSLHVNTADEESASWINDVGIFAQDAADAINSIYLGQGDDLPASLPSCVGRLFIKTGSNPGLYVCTASTSSSSTWKAVSHAS